MMKGGYDSGYIACPCFWGHHPGSLVVWLKEYLRTFDGLSVLDAGCGEGKNSIYFARDGATIRAIDISDRAILNGQRTWPDYKKVVWEVCDIRAAALPKDGYDIVVAYGLLHCLTDYDEVGHVVETLKQATRPGGFNIICTFNNRHQELVAHPDLSPVLLCHSDYISMYSDWEILYGTDADLKETHPHNGISHTHSLSRIIARKGQIL